MQMKVHNKGQVVIPAEIRRELGIAIGDQLDIHIDIEAQRIELKKHIGDQAQKLAGSLHQYGMNKTFPSREEMHQSLSRGLGRDG